MKVAVFQWNDAAEDPGGFLSKQECARLNASLTSAGLLVSLDDQQLCIAVDYWADEDSWRSVHTIPRSLIRGKVRVVDV